MEGRLGYPYDSGEQVFPDAGIAHSLQVKTEDFGDDEPGNHVEQDHGALEYFPGARILDRAAGVHLHEDVGYHHGEDHVQHCDQCILLCSLCFGFRELGAHVYSPRVEQSYIIALIYVNVNTTLQKSFKYGILSRHETVDIRF